MKQGEQRAGAEQAVPPTTEELERIAARLDELTALLRDSSLAAERAIELAREASELAAQAAAEVDRQVRYVSRPLSDADQDELF